MQRAKTPVGERSEYNSEYNTEYDTVSAYRIAFRMASGTVSQILSQLQGFSENPRNCYCIDVDPVESFSAKLPYGTAVASESPF
jgi:hypothetical protein